MLEFRRVRMEDGDRIRSIYHSAPDRGCEYTFGNIYIWHDVYCTKVAFSQDGYCVVRFDCSVNAYLFPVGGQDLKAVITDMMADAESHGVPFRIIAATAEDVAQLDALFPGVFEHHTNRDFAEYVYNSEDLIHLAGKKYHGKRNHIARFTRQYPEYVFEEITPENIAGVRAMNDAWYNEYLEDDAGLTDEKTAARYAFESFFDLGLRGGFLRVGQKIVAFAMGEPINSETFCVHMEKACYDYEGAYSVINRDFAAHFCGGYRYINREDDVGEEGLRKAKLSYYPAVITEKMVVTKK